MPYLVLLALAPQHEEVKPEIRITRSAQQMEDVGLYDTSPQLRYVIRRARTPTVL